MSYVLKAEIQVILKPEIIISVAVMPSKIDWVGLSDKAGAKGLERMGWALQFGEQLVTYSPSDKITVLHDLVSEIQKIMAGGVHEVEMSGYGVVDVFPVEDHILHFFVPGEGQVTYAIDKLSAIRAFSDAANTLWSDLVS